jgi:hypothetical protein
VVFLFKFCGLRAAQKEKMTEKYKQISHMFFVDKETLPFIERDKTKTVEEPLSKIEVFAIERSFPGLVDLIADGAIGRMIDYTGNFFIVLFKTQCKKEEETIDEVMCAMPSSQPMTDAQFQVFAQQVFAEHDQQIAQFIEAGTKNKQINEREV